jgi:hypothetical protein
MVSNGGFLIFDTPYYLCLEIQGEIYIKAAVGVFWEKKEVSAQCNI